MLRSSWGVSGTRAEVVASCVDEGGFCVPSLVR